MSKNQGEWKNTGAQSAPENKKKRYRRKRKSASIYFLLWTVFSAFAFLMLLLFGITQYVVTAQVFKGEAARDVGDKGQRIQKELSAPLPSTENFSIYVERLAHRYDVSVVLFNAEGDVLLPKPQEGDSAAITKKQANKLLQELSKREEDSVVYEGDGEYVYGAELKGIDGSVSYLYVAKSLELFETANESMGIRLLLASLFTFVLAFAVASAVSGWLTRPIAEITQKSRRLAEGDFDVDFHGNDYGEELASLADALNFARDELSKTDAMQKELIANVSHDFKTPLTMIKAYASMIKEISGANPEKREKHAQVIIDEADRLTALVTDVLDLSKMRSGLETIRKESVDISTAVEEILSRFEYLESEHGYILESHIERELYTVGDSVKLEQVLYNLIGNAVNYTGADKKVFVNLCKIDDTLFRFSVTDTGEGIAEDELSTIWDRYYRSSQAHKRPVKGTGLGLSIVKTVLQKHGFAFGVESRQGEGSTFYVDFPMEGENA